jgi:hypothetical protein
MNNTVFLLTLSLISNLVYSQCEESNKLKFGGTYGDSSFKNSEMAFKYFSYNADTTQYCCDIKSIKLYADFIIEKSEKHITQRAGSDFFDKLIFQDIMVIYHDFKKLDNYYETYLDLDRCGKITYWITYEYQFSNSVKYGFGLEFDKEGHLVSSEKFPDFSKNPKAEEIIDACTAIQRVRHDKQFENKQIKSIELNFLEETNSFCWLVKEDENIQLDKKIREPGKFYDYSVRSFYVNGNTNKIDKIHTQHGQIIYCVFGKK